MTKPDEIAPFSIVSCLPYVLHSKNTLDLWTLNSHFSRPAQTDPYVHLSYDDEIVEPKMFGNILCLLQGMLTMEIAMKRTMFVYHLLKVKNNETLV